MEGGGVGGGLIVGLRLKIMLTQTSKAQLELARTGAELCNNVGRTENPVLPGKVP